MRSLFLVLSSSERQSWAEAVAAACHVTQPSIFTGSPAQAALHLGGQSGGAPSHIVLDIGTHGQDILSEIDLLAQQCEPGTRVIAVGDTNDVLLYRGLLARGVIDYLPMPAAPQDVAAALTAPPAHHQAPAPAAPAPVTVSVGEKRVIAFMSAASGDGASTAALNTAFALSQLFNGTTVLVDMDYQFGMVAKHLDLQNQYGIRDLFDHPERGIDATLIKRMVASYGKLHVITAPAELRYLPSVSAEAIRDLVNTLKLSYDNVVLDLPHVWLPWVAAVCQQSTTLVLVSQLWLKSVSHAARLMRVFRELNIPLEKIATVINRSGAKFKEAIDPRDFERVCGIPIRYTLANDIKTITAAEGSARTVLEVDGSELSGDIMRLARGLAGLPQEPVGEAKAPRAGGLLGKFKRA